MTHLVFLTNNFDLPPRTIADLYRARWRVELFFKWIKQHLRIKADGHLVAWGANFEGQCDIPAPNAGFVSIAAGAYHSLAIRSGGAIAAWGANSSGECNVPSPNTGFVVVAAGMHHSLGIRADGSVVGWGENSFGQCNTPQPNTGFVAVDAAETFSVGLKADGTVVTWGDNWTGVCDGPTSNADFIAVAADGNRYSAYCLGLKADGTIVIWGYVDGLPIPDRRFMAIAAGAYCRLGIVLPEDVHNEQETVEHLPGSETMPERVITNRPNPFNPRTTVNFTLPEAGHAVVAIYDARGMEVARLVDEVLAAGAHTVDWAGVDAYGRALPSGTYFCRLTSSWGVETRKLQLIR